MRAIAAAHTCERVCGVCRDAGEPVLLPRASASRKLKQKQGRERDEQGFVRLSRLFWAGDAVRAQSPDDDPCPSRGAPDLLSRWRDGDGSGERGAARADGALRRCGESLGAARLQSRRPRLRAGCFWFSISTGAGSSAWAIRPMPCCDFGRSEIEMSRKNSCVGARIVSLLEDFDTADNFDGTLFELTEACFEQSWQVAGGWQRYSWPGIVLHRLSGPQIDRADVGEARLGDRIGQTLPATPACPARISTSCSAARPALPRTST